MSQLHTETPQQTNTINGAEALVRILEAHGVRHIFGLCGDTTLPFYDALYRLDHGIEHILVRDERHAAYMADAYARVSGRVGVCEGPSGGGATYILPGLVEANESSSAVLSITSDISVASHGKYPLTEVDQQALMRPLTKWNHVVTRAEHIPRMVRAAFRAMTTGRPGAAHLGLPYDIQYDPVPPEDIWADDKLQRFPAYPQAPEPGAVEAALGAILSASNPLIVCGGGVIIAGATGELASLAERLDIPVATSISGQGALAEVHPNCVGVVGSNGGTDETWAMMQRADLVVFMGSRAGSTTTARWECPGPQTRVVHFDSDPMVIGANYPVEAAVVGDLRLALQQMLSLLDETAHPSGFGGAEAVEALKKLKFERFREQADYSAVPIRPACVVDTLQQVLPAETIIVSDPGTSCPYLSAYFQLPAAGRSFITNRAHGALGYAMSAAFGAWVARPEYKVVALMGDGAFGFTCGELETIMRYRAPITFIVLSNASYGWIKASQQADQGGRFYNVDFGRTDHGAVASAYGLKTWRVEDPAALEPAIRAATEYAGASLVDVVIQPLEQSQAPVRRWMG